MKQVPYILIYFPKCKKRLSKMQTWQWHSSSIKMWACESYHCWIVFHTHHVKQRKKAGNEHTAFKWQWHKILLRLSKKFEGNMNVYNYTSYNVIFVDYHWILSSVFLSVVNITEITKNERDKIQLPYVLDVLVFHKTEVWERNQSVIFQYKCT